MNQRRRRTTRTTSDQMTTATITPTYATGARGKASLVVSVPPDRIVDDATSSRDLPQTGLNMPFLADVISAVLAHERCGLHLYRSVAGRTRNPVLREKYEEFGRETAHHAEIVHDLIEATGGDPRYVSPAARATEGMDTRLVESTFMLAGSCDPVTAEMVMLDAVLLAETADHANWAGMLQLTSQLPAGELRDRMADAVAEVLSDEHEHLTWARDTRTAIITTIAESEPIVRPESMLPDLAERVRSWFS